jgi:glycolate oxidase iron-sulfur subunit
MDRQSSNARTAMPHAGTGTFPFELTDMCVKCGLCAPHCPTYQLTGEEGESPRGRISLIQGLAGGHLQATPRLREHLDNCLTCRSCERVCPAKVPFARVIDAGRAELQESRGPSSTAVRALSVIAENPRLGGVSLRLLRVARAIGVHRLISLFGLEHRSWLFRAIARLDPPSAGPLSRNIYPTQNEEIDRVALFTGCVARTLDTHTHRATIKTLNAIGYTVTVPSGQTCCGALALHDGDARSAKRMARTNEIAFSETSDAVISSATGCAATLREYGHRQTGDTQLAPGPGVIELCDFLIRQIERLKPRLGPLDISVALHTPCTAHYATPGGDKALQLLSQVPGLVVEQLESTGCCGAAGHHFLTRFAQADALLSPLLQGVERLGPDFVVTSNPGCALHFAGGLAVQRSKVPVVHPVSLIAMSLAAKA